MGIFYNYNRTGLRGYLSGSRKCSPSVECRAILFHVFYEKLIIVNIFGKWKGELFAMVGGIEEALRTTATYSVERKFELWARQFERHWVTSHTTIFGRHHTDKQPLSPTQLRIRTHGIDKATNEVSNSPA